MTTNRRNVKLHAYRIQNFVVAAKYFPKLKYTRIHVEIFSKGWLQKEVATKKRSDEQTVIRLSMMLMN